jgi:hypothetical protein
MLENYSKIFLKHLNPTNYFEKQPQQRVKIECLALAIYFNNNGYYFHHKKKNCKKAIFVIHKLKIAFFFQYPFFIRKLSFVKPLSY